MNPGKVVSAERTSATTYPARAIKSVKVYAHDKLISFILEADPAYTFNKLHVYLDADNNPETGGYNQFADKDAELMIEGPTADAAKMNYFRWDESKGKNGWNWTGTTTQSWKFMTGAVNGNFYEYQIDITKIKNIGGFTFAEQFGIGFDFQNNWENPIGRIPCGWPTPNKLDVTFDK